jgi:type I restriction-modification system DNA methylase subunit
MFESGGWAVVIWLRMNLFGQVIILPQIDFVDPIEHIHLHPILSELITSSYKEVDVKSEDYSSWLKDFKAIHGELNTQKTKLLRPIETAYSIEIKERTDLFKLIYVLESSYSILVTFIAFKGIQDEADPHTPISSILNGDYFLSRGIKNFRTKGYFNWQAQHPALRNKVTSLLTTILADYQLNLAFDAIKLIYERLFIKQIRHSMGEYFTPDWMARHILNKIQSSDENCINKSFLDPSCGSGPLFLM